MGREGRGIAQHVVCEAVEEYVRRHENEELVRRLDEAYADGPDEEALRHGQALHAEMLRRAEREGRQ